MPQSWASPSPELRETNVCFYDSPVSAIPLSNKVSQEIGTIEAGVVVTNVQTAKAALGPGDELEAGPVLRGMLGWGLCCHKWRAKKTLLRAQREEIFVLFCFVSF